MKVCTIDNPKNTWQICQSTPISLGWILNSVSSEILTKHTRNCSKAYQHIAGLKQQTHQSCSFFEDLQAKKLIKYELSDMAFKMKLGSLTWLQKEVLKSGCIKQDRMVFKTRNWHWNNLLRKEWICSQQTNAIKIIKGNCNQMSLVKISSGSFVIPFLRNQ